MNWAIDVSSYDAYTSIAGKTTYVPIDWAKTGTQLAIIKSSEALREDPAFKIQWAAAKGVLPRVAYHFFRCNVNAIAQAEFVKSILADDFDRSTDFVALDFETADGVEPRLRLTALGSWLYEIEKFGAKPFIYTYRSFWLEAGGANAAWAKQYPLWFAAWPLDNWIAAMPLPPYIFTAEKLAALKADVISGKLKPRVPAPWTDCAIWQFTARADTKAVPGHPAIKKVCDYNIVYAQHLLDMPLPGVEEKPPAPVRERMCPYSVCPKDGE
jgi:GH25 family lysozyme M1 (1,4-beta-N-acetylmuramidase)